MSHTRSRWLPVLFSLCALILFPCATRAEESEDCATCHDQLVQSFKATIHGQIGEFETPEGVIGCITCHGDGAAHLDNGGEAGSIQSLNPDTLAVEVGDVCMSCHRSHALNDWNGSVHALNDVGCSDCHRVHELADHTVAGGAIPGWERQISPALVRGGADPVVCLDCHSEVRAQLQYPSHHPVREGHMNCGSCHDPHGNTLGNQRSEVSDSEMCLSCHSHLQGPFMFEHEPVSEGCDTCHTPHGSVTNNLLAQNEPFICLQCHEFHFHAGLEGEEDDEVYIPAYDPDFDPDNTNRDTYPGGAGLRR